MHILAFGDSLTAGYGLPADKSFAAQLEQRLRDEGLDVRVTNAIRRAAGWPAWTGPWRIRPTWSSSNSAPMTACAA